MPMTSQPYTAPAPNSSARPTPRKGESASPRAYYTHSPYWYQDAPVLDSTQEDQVQGDATVSASAPTAWSGQMAVRPRSQTPYGTTPQLSRVPSETGHRTSESSSQDGSTCSGEHVYSSNFARPMSAAGAALARLGQPGQPICSDDDQTTLPTTAPRPSLPPAYGATHDYHQTGNGGEDPCQSTGRTPDHLAPFHTSLSGVCDFLSLPQALPTPLHWPAQRCIESDGTTRRVFIGHTRFETTAEQIAFVVQHACGVVPAWVVNHRMGCFVVHLDSEEAWRKVLAYQKRIYFDTVGVWIARTPMALQALNAEVEAVSHGPRSFTFRRWRLPRGTMVIEPFTDDDAGSPIRVSGRPKRH